MSIHMSALAATMVALLIGQLGCTSIVGERYYEGDGIAADAGVHPPHSRFHPVPSRPVFSPKPNATLTIAQRQVTPQPTPAVRTASADATLGTATTTHSQIRKTAARQTTVEQTSSKTPSPKPTANSSRRVASAEESANESDVGPASHVSLSAADETMQPSGAWTDRFGATDGWRPRAR